MGAKHHQGLRVITCCYCSARSTLGRDARKLVCHGCGAPISLIEHLGPAPSKKPHRPGDRKPALAHPAEKPRAHKPKDRAIRRRKGKRKKQSFWSRVGDVFDDFGDLDDLLDLDDLFD